MRLKISISNIKRNLNDYAIYLMTLIISLSIVNAMASIGTSDDIMMLADNMAMLKTYSTITTVLLMGIVAYLTSYVTNDLLSKRKKEFGVLVLSGMKKKKIADIFILELRLMSLIALIMSIPISLIFQKVLIVMLQAIFETKHLSLNLNSLYSYLLIIVFLIGSQGIGGILIRRKVKKAEVYDLLLDKRKNTPVSEKSIVAHYIIVVISMISCILGIFLVIKGLKSMDNIAYLWFFVSSVALLLGAFGLSHRSILIFCHLNMSSKIDKNHGVGLVIKGLIASKSITNAKSIGMISVFLTLSFILLMMGLSIGRFYKENVKSEVPFDIGVSIDHPEINFLPVLDYIEASELIDDYYQYLIYTNGLSVNIVDSEYPESYMLLSDYNRIRTVLKLSKVSLNKNEFSIHAEGWESQKKIRDMLSDDKTIAVGSNELIHSQEVYTDYFSQYGFNGTHYLVVVPDELKNSLQGQSSRLIVTTKVKANPELKGQLKKFIKGNKNLLNSDIKLNKDSRITMGVMSKSWSVANGLAGLAILSFISLYIGIIFTIVSLTLLALQQLTQSDRYKDALSVLLTIGFTKKQCNNVIQKQLFIYFFLPLFVPLLILSAVTILLQKYFGSYSVIPGLFVNGSLLTVLILGSMYFLYYQTTYIIQKKFLIDGKV